MSWDEILASLKGAISGFWEYLMSFGEFLEMLGSSPVGLYIWGQIAVFLPGLMLALGSLLVFRAKRKLGINHVRHAAQANYLVKFEGRREEVLVTRALESYPNVKDLNLDIAARVTLQRGLRATAVDQPLPRLEQYGPEGIHVKQELIENYILGIHSGCDRCFLFQTYENYMLPLVVSTFFPRFWSMVNAILSFLGLGRKIGHPYIKRIRHQVWLEEDLKKMLDIGKVLKLGVEYPSQLRRLLTGYICAHAWKVEEERIRKKIWQPESLWERVAMPVNLNLSGRPDKPTVANPVFPDWSNPEYSQLLAESLPKEYKRTVFPRLLPKQKPPS